MNDSWKRLIDLIGRYHHYMDGFYAENYSWTLIALLTTYAFKERKIYPPNIATTRDLTEGCGFGIHFTGT